MADETSLGRRVQAVRKRRGLTQQELAMAAGLSVSLIRKLEQDIIADVRMETARKIATALRVHTTALMTEPDAAPPEETDAGQWEPVRRALEGRPGARLSEEPTLDGLALAFNDAVPLVLASRYAELRAILPGLLRDADALVAAASNGTETAARNLRSQIRQLTAYMMGQTWQFDAANDAISLAADDASDRLTALAAADWKCWALLRQGRLAETAALAARWADDAEPRRISRATAGDLAAWGRCLILVSTAAVRDNRPGEAKDALKLARMAAIGIGRDIIPACNPWQVFGPVTVSMVRAENAIIQDRPDTTLSVAAQLSGAGFPVPRNWNRHRLDVAAACAARRQTTEAAEIVAEVRDAAPEWLAQQRYARDIVTRIIDRRRTLTPRMHELAAAVRLPV
jgi:transcriptional regulator with XRE-family HTH domain